MEALPCWRGRKFDGGVSGGVMEEEAGRDSRGVRSDCRDSLPRWWWWWWWYDLSERLELDRNDVENGLDGWKSKPESVGLADDGGVGYRSKEERRSK